MSKIVRRVLVGASTAFALSAATLFAQGTPLQESFDRLVQNHAALVSAGRPQSEQVALVAGWVQANDWRALTTRDISWLYIALDAEQLNPNQFSARWTGTIRAPVTGFYNFEQRRQYHADGALKVSIGGQVVLNSTAAAASQQDSRDYRAVVDDPRYRSVGFQLTAGQPLEFEAEFVFDRHRMVSNSEVKKRLFPVVILEWQSPGVPKQIVPQTAFATAGGQPGLMGEYFNDLQFGQLVGRHIDPGLQMIWYKKAVCSSQHEAQAEMRDHCWPLVRDNQYLVELSEDEQQATQGDPFLADVPFHERQAFLIEVSSRLLRGASATARRELISNIRGRPEQLAKLSPFAMADILAACFPVLDADDIRYLLTDWSEVRQPDAPRVGIYPGTGINHFQSNAYEPYRDIGSLLAGPRAEAATELIDTHLIRPDDSPNLLLIYCAAFSVFANQQLNFESVYPTGSPRAAQLRDNLQSSVTEQLDDSARTGDKRARWLLAQAYLHAVFAGDPPRPWLGLEFLEEAYLNAESPAMKFRIVQELVTRLISIDRSPAATEWLQAANLTDPDHVRWSTEMQAKATQMTDYYEQVRVQGAQAQAAAAHESYLNELRRRHQQAAGRGDDYEVSLYERLIAEVGGQSAP